MKSCSLTFLVLFSVALVATAVDGAYASGGSGVPSSELRYPANGPGGAKVAPLDFYTPPAALPRQPGCLLRFEPVFARWVPARSRAWRILYTTMDDGRITAASGVVIVPQGATGAHSAPADVIAWAHGTSGIDRQSAPSLDKVGLEVGAMYIGQQIIDQGWAIVATDYIGLGTPGPHKYLVGKPAAHAVLDSVRAAYQLRGAALSRNIVVWGHSQGGAAALWTGIEAPAYAPELPIRGIAALAPAADVAATMNAFPDVIGGEVLTAYVIQGYSWAYHDVDFDFYVRPDARVRVHEMAQHGVKTASTVGSAIIDKIFNRPIWLHDPATGPLRSRLSENDPTGPIPAPLLVAQGLSDPLVLPAATMRYVDARRAAGYQVDFREFPGDHVGLVKANSPLIPQLFAWTERRFDARR